jgi:EPS-associated MarR family transcriptional regulator
MSNIENYFKILRTIQKKPFSTQREMAKQLGFSLGKLNYCLKALKVKGLIKIKNFNLQKKKIQYIKYVLTPKGILERSRLTVNFMHKKLKEYDELKKEMKSKNFNIKL